MNEQKNENETRKNETNEKTILETLNEKLEKLEQKIEKTENETELEKLENEKSEIENEIEKIEIENLNSEFEKTSSDMWFEIVYSETSVSMKMSSKSVSELKNRGFKFAKTYVSRKHRELGFDMLLNYVRKHSETFSERVS